MVPIMAGVAVSWYSRQKNLDAISSTEANYISLRSDTTETIWTRRLIDDTKFVPDVKHLTAMLTDNQGGIGLVGNESVNKHTKLIDV